MWHHSVTSRCDITWYHTVMAYVMSHPCWWLKLPARRHRVPQVQPPPRHQRPEARTPSQHPPPRRRWRLSLLRWWHQGRWLQPCFGNWPAGSHHCCTATQLHLQNFCTAGSSQRGMVQKNQTMCKREMIQIKQIRDILKTEYHFIEIVLWKISTD
jgi:hypothetical protein